MASKRPPRKPKTTRGPHAKYEAPADAQPWERQTGESASAYAGFERYRDMDLPRSAFRAAEGSGKSGSQFEKWASAHDWPQRVGAFDRQAQLRRAEEAMARQEERQREQLEILDTLQAGGMVLAGSLNARLAELAENPEAAKDLDLEAVVRMSMMFARAFPRLVQTERLVTGRSTENVGGHDGGAVKVEASRQAAAMPRAEVETYLLGFNDGAAVAGAADEPAAVEAEDARRA